MFHAHPTTKDIPRQALMGGETSGASYRSDWGETGERRKGIVGLDRVHMNELKILHFFSHTTCFFPSLMKIPQQLSNPMAVSKCIYHVCIISVTSLLAFIYDRGCVCMCARACSRDKCFIISGCPELDTDHG